MSCAMQEDKANLYQFLYHVTIVVTFQVKSCPGSFCFYFCRSEISFNSDKKWSILLSADDTSFCQFSADSADS